MSNVFYPRLKKAHRFYFKKIVRLGNHGYHHIHMTFGSNPSIRESISAGLVDERNTKLRPFLCLQRWFSLRLQRRNYFMCQTGEDHKETVSSKILCKTQAILSKDHRTSFLF